LHWIPAFDVALPGGVFTSGQDASRADLSRLPTLDRLDLETLTVNVEVRVVSWITCISDFACRQVPRSE